LRSLNKEKQGSGEMLQEKVSRKTDCKKSKEKIRKRGKGHQRRSLGDTGSQSSQKGKKGGGERKKLFLKTGRDNCNQT